MVMLSAQSPLHIPVLLDEVLAAAAIQPGERHVDATFGAGGYTLAMLAAGAKVHSFDRDPDAIRDGAPLVAAANGALTLHHARFSELARVLAEAGITAVDGVVFDIGVSSMQIDQAERGFSFQKNGPLDFRMSQTGESAADFLNTASEATIADVIFLYGEERQSRRIARAIVAARPLETTLQLAQIVRKALGYHAGMPKDPATRTFQGLRIHINDELGELERGLAAAEAILRPGGRIIIVTFQSLEDRIVKNFLRQRSGSQASGSRHMPDMPDTGPAPSFAKPSKAIRAGDAECMANPRARSATLRWAVRTAAPAWPQGSAAA